MQEVRARGGRTLRVSQTRACNLETALQGIHTTRMPALIQDFQAPILYTIPLQLLAYHVAILKGTDVDQPRNLAKSVTVGVVRPFAHEMSSYRLLPDIAATCRSSSHERMPDIR